MCISVANNRLFVGSIPKSKTKEQIVEEFAKVTGESAQSFNVCFGIILSEILTEMLFIILIWCTFLWFDNFD